jgi:hypothetical protein
MNIREYLGADDKKPRNKYKEFKKSLPSNLSGTPEREYAMKRYWKDEGKPKDFKEAQSRKRPMFYEVYHPEEGRSAYHSVSTSEKTSKMYKPKKHATTYKELEAYKSDPEMREFKDKNKVVSRGRYLKYVSKTKRDLAKPERNEKRVEKFIAKSQRTEAKENKKNLRSVKK